MRLTAFRLQVRQMTMFIGAGSLHSPSAAARWFAAYADDIVVTVPGKMSDLLWPTGDRTRQATRRFESANRIRNAMLLYTLFALTFALLFKL